METDSYQLRFGAWTLKVPLQMSSLAFSDGAIEIPRLMRRDVM